MQDIVAPIDSGDTAWMMIATALVLLMTLPGLALLYAGMVRVKNALSVLMQCFAIAALVTVLWIAYGYSLAFDGAGTFVGGLGKAFLAGLTPESVVGTIPESVFATFQMTFAIITPALTVGAFAERMKFGALVVFVVAWFTLVYVPLAHMVWGGPGALMWDWGVLDFAGGTVVHVNAGIAGLTAALVIGRRHGYPGHRDPAAQRALRAGRRGAAVGRLVRLQCGQRTGRERDRRHGAAGDTGGDGGGGAGVDGPRVGGARQAERARRRDRRDRRPGRDHARVRHRRPAGAMLIGLVAGGACFVAATRLKRIFGYDDSLDVFGVHAVGGIVGAVLTGVTAGTLGGTGLPEGVSIAGQVWIQAKSVLFTAAWSGIGTCVILKLIDATVGVRVSREQEVEGLDLALHDERAYNH